MMYEDDYPWFLKTYRNLRKEGVIFPARDTSERFMLSSMGLESPMFDYLEETKHKKSTGLNSSVIVEKTDLDFDETNKAEKEFKKFVGGTIGIVSRESNSRSLARVNLGKIDIETIRSYMEIIDDICISAEDVNDIKTDLGLEMYKYCQAFYTRCRNIVSAKSTHGVEHQMDILMSLSEDLDVRIKLYKNTFIDLTLKKIKEKKPNIQKKINNELTNQKTDEEEKKVPSKHRKTAIKPLPPPPSNQFFQFDTKQEPLVDLLDDFYTENPQTNLDKISVNNPQPSPKNLLNLQIEADPIIENKQENLDNVEIKNINDDFFENLANRK